MSIRIKDFPIFRNHLSTLAKTSVDTSEGNPVQMTDSDLPAINFDDVKTEYTNKLGLSNQVAASCDALVLGDKTYLIEFKNGKLAGLMKDVKIKMKDSLLIYCDITKKTISDTRKDMEFILVYNADNAPHNNPKLLITNWLGNKAGMTICPDGIGLMKGLYFSDVSLCTAKEMEAKIKAGIVGA